jgi:hypothetical protein
MYESSVTRVLREVLDASDRPLRVIEIGTAYGEHLYQLRGCVNLEELVSIDPMYDWVPDLRPEDSFDQTLVDNAKVSSWHRNAEGMPASLIVGKSHDVAVGNRLPHSDFDVLLIDGCHHPPSAVEADYWDFASYLRQDHVVIFDDVNGSDPGIASDTIESQLLEKGATVSREDREGGRVRIFRVSV